MMTIRDRSVYSLLAREGVTTCLLLIGVFLLSASLSPVSAQALEAFEGEYVITLAAQQIPDTVSGVKIAAARAVRLPKEVTVHSTLSSSAILLRSRSAETMQAQTVQTKIVRVDPSDTFCKNLLASTEGIASCSPNYRVQALTTTPNDPSYSRLYGLTATQGVNAPRAWELTAGSADVVVGVVDTGIDYNHPDLRDNMWRNPGEVEGNGIDDDRNGVIDDVYGFNAITGSGNPMDDNLHGTHCAGTIGAVGNNGVGVVGVNQRLRMIGLKFLDEKGSGSLANAIKAIDYAIAIKQKYGIQRLVLNNSWGGGGYVQGVYDVIERAKAAGIVFAAAAGNSSNDNDANPSYPSGYDLSNVVGVAAVDKNGNIAGFSNYGATTVDIAAPGVDILSTAPNGGYASLSGTSMATPHVAGALALLWSSEPSLTPDALITRLYLSGRTLTSLRDTASGQPLVRSQRVADVGRMVYNETAPLPAGAPETPACGYTVSPSNALLGQIDTAADNQPIINQQDEGSFNAIPLKFEFPFFRGSTSVVYLSPNGVVYTKAPTGLDFQVGARAPFNAIAALHTDLTPLRTNHGIRVYSGPEKATISWVAEHYASQGQGEITVRITLFPNGIIASSVSFGASGELIALRRSVLGDPFAAPATAAKALIGVTGATAAFSSTLDIAAAQQALLGSGNEPFALGVSMVPNCAPEEGSGVGPAPRVTQISVKTTSRRSTLSSIQTVEGTLRGTGSGTIELRVALDGKECPQVGSIMMQNGSASFTGKLPKVPARVTYSSSGIARTIRMKQTGTVRVSPARRALMCRTVTESLKAG